MQRNTAITVGIALLLVLAGCSASASPSASSPSTSAPAADREPTTPSDDESTIQVEGSGSADAAPNQAVVRVAVVAHGDDAATARQRLATNTSRMRTALEEVGVGPSQIKTERYDIRRDRRRPRPGQDDAELRIQYRAEHDFEITVTDPDRVGTVIDTAVQNGATEVDDVTFTLSSERRRELEERARSAAMRDARTKARTFATHANLTVTGVDVIQTTSAGTPRRADYAATETAAPTPSAPSDLDAGPVTVRTTVRVVYKATESEDATA